MGTEPSLRFSHLLHLYKSSCTAQCVWEFGKPKSHFALLVIIVVGLCYALFQRCSKDPRKLDLLKSEELCSCEFCALL